jgi:hypothetical protein
VATIRQSNVAATKTLAELKHFKHAMSRNKNWWRKRLQRHFGFDVWKLPVCERCEGWALWHQENGQKVGACMCGHITRNPITVEEFYERGYHIDKTGYGRDAPLIVERQLARPKDVATVYGGEADLQDQHRKIVVARS